MKRKAIVLLVKEVPKLEIQENHLKTILIWLTI